MCDYSLQHVESRAAKAGDKLISTRFPTSMTRGFTEPGHPDVAVCLLPGTEVAFDKDVEYEANFPLLPRRRMTERVARFRQIDMDKPAVHHDALEFANGQIILVTRVTEGQTMTVLQMPAPAYHRDEAREPTETRAQPPVWPAVDPVR